MILKSNHLAKLIKTRRQELKMSQAQIHNYMGWRQLQTQYISNIELGKCQLPAKHINKLSSTLHLSREEIIESMIQDYKEALLNEVSK